MFFYRPTCNLKVNNNWIIMKIIIIGRFGSSLLSFLPHRQNMTGLISQGDTKIWSIRFQRFTHLTLFNKVPQVLKWKNKYFDYILNLTFYEKWLTILSEICIYHYSTHISKETMGWEFESKQNTTLISTRYIKFKGVDFSLNRDVRKLNKVYWTKVLLDRGSPTLTGISFSKN